MQTTLQDLRFALRTLVGKNLPLTLICILTLGLGIGANTAIFSVVRGVLLDPLPYPEPERLVRLYSGRESRPERHEFMTGPDFLDLRELSDVFTNVACAYTYSDVGFDLTGDGPPERVAALRVSSGFFELLGSRPLLGRGFTRDEENAETRHVVLGHGLWQSRFDGDPAILGRAVLLDGASYTVTGVMPAGFRSPVGRHVDLWVPQNLRLGGSNHRHNYYLTAVGRLRSGVSLEQARSGVALLSDRIARQHPDIRTGWLVHVVPMKEDVVADSRPMLLALLGAVGLVLLIACVNVANLLLVRGAARRKELAVRAALGSGQGRLIRQLLTENLVLAGLGGLAGTGLAWAGVRLLLLLRPAGLPRLEDVGVDPRLFLASATLSLLTGLLFGLVPAFYGGRVRLERALREEGRGLSGSPWMRRFRQSLVVFQVAIALVLLTGAGLLVRSFVRLMEVDLGFRPEGVLSYLVHLPATRYAEGVDRIRFYRQFHDRLAALPGVESVGAVSKLPLAGRYHTWGFRTQQDPADDDEGWQPTDVRVVDGRYFDAMGISLLRGRRFDQRDHAEAPRVVLINETVAGSLWSEGNPIGQQIHLGGEPRTIVGVVDSTRHEHRAVPAPKVYLPHRQFADDRNWALTQVVRTTTPGGDVLGRIRKELAAIDPDLILHRARPLESLAALDLARQRFALLLMGAFAGVALMLAAIGLFGVLAFTVEERTREIGIRVALGARRDQIRRLVLVQCLALTSGGLAAGLFGALLTTRWLSSLIFEIRATDPATFVAVAAVLAGVAMVSAWVPVRRAIRVDPLEILRYE